ncbi:MAG TPA: hypothetical protein VEG39_12390 [Clostridia bacterium]|nr:hypothetical protein [Clostridia bacterium]
MTVSMKVRSTLAMLEGVLSDFKTMHTESSDGNTRKEFERLISETDIIVGKLRARIEEIAEEEPQYREDQ